MKAADFGRYVGKTFQKIDRSLDFLPATPRKIAVATALVAGLPIIAGGFFFLVRMPAEVPEPIVEAKSEEVDEALQQANATEEQGGLNPFDLLDGCFNSVENGDGFISELDEHPNYLAGESHYSFMGYKDL